MLFPKKTKVDYVHVCFAWVQACCNIPGKPFSIMRLIYLSLFICNDQREGDSLIGYGLNAHK